LGHNRGGPNVASYILSQFTRNNDRIFSPADHDGMTLPLVAAYPLLSSLEGQTMKAPGISKDPTLYVVPYAHLDAQWRWEMPQSQKKARR
jgi:hypothetical protein